jgi:hypothetical protein
VSWYTTYRSAMLVATCNRLFQISSETRTIEIDDSIVRRYASDTERDRESYTEVCDAPSGCARWSARFAGSEPCGSPRFFMIQIKKKTGGTKPPAQMSKPSETEREEVWVSW